MGRAGTSPMYPSASCGCPGSFEIDVWLPVSHPSGFFSKPGVLNLENIHQCLEAALVLLLTASGYGWGRLPDTLQDTGQLLPAKLYLSVLRCQYG